MKVVYDARNNLGQIVSEEGELPLIQIQFQHGLVSDKGRNGVFDEELIQLVILRLRHWNAGLLHYRENSLAITKLEEALMWLEKRTQIRQAQDVEGTMEPHAS